MGPVHRSGASEGQAVDLDDSQERFVRAVAGCRFGKITVWGEMPGAGTIVSIDTDILDFHDFPFRVHGSLKNLGSEYKFACEAIIKSWQHPVRGPLGKLFLLLTEHFPKSLPVTPSMKIKISRVEFGLEVSLLAQMQFH